MAQTTFQTDRRVLIVGGRVIESKIVCPEGGYDMDSVEAPEPGNTGLIATGQKKMKPRKYTMTAKRNHPDLIWLYDWEKSGSDARDVQEYFTDKSGDIQNAYKIITYEACELGPIVEPEANEKTPETAVVDFTLFPLRRDVTLV